MMTRTVRAFALTAFLSAGLIAGSGCNTENPDGTKNALGKTEEVIKKDAKIVGDKAKELEHKAEEGAKKGMEAAGKGLEKAGEKLQDMAKPAPGAPPTTTPPVETPK